MKWKYSEKKFVFERALSPSDSQWYRHIYFAYDLIASIKPKVVVELGTHKGVSLFAMAQAVKDNKLKTNLNAVDTWLGDKQAGLYGEEVLNGVKDLSEKYFSEVNIQLLRKTFDEALADFPDGSIDILHIDGLHTYEAVKNDFLKWKLKVRKTGIIMMHDIFERKETFGVYKLWEEISPGYENIEFPFAHGLGVLFLDKKVGKEVLEFKTDLINHYSLISEKVILEEEAEVIKKTSAMITERDELIRSLQTENEVLRAENTKSPGGQVKNFVKKIIKK